MHLSQKLKLRSDSVPLLRHSANNMTSKTSEATAPVKTRNNLNIKDKRNIKIGIVALRTIGKWTDKAALTLEKLESQDTSKHSHEHKDRLNTNNRSSANGEIQEPGLWRETVVCPVPVRTGVSKAAEVRDEPTACRELLAFGREEAHDAVQVTEVPNREDHHAHTLATVPEYYSERSDDEDERDTCGENVIRNDAKIHTDTDQCSSDVSSDGEEDNNDKNLSPGNSDDETDSDSADSSDDVSDSGEEVRIKYLAVLHAKK